MSTAPTETVIEIEASEWVTRMEGPVDERTLDELQAWAAQSPEHLREFLDQLSLKTVLDVIRAERLSTPSDQS